MAMVNGIKRINAKFSYYYNSLYFRACLKWFGNKAKRKKLTYII